MEPQDNEMSADEVIRFLEVCAEFGVKKAKFTGGEPMLRDDLEEILDRTPNTIETSLTTNGTFLSGRADALVEAGLSRVNVSQDAVDPETFSTVTQTGAYDQVINGVLAAVDAGLTPVKLNMVVFEGTAGYVPEMVDHVVENPGLQLQLIEYMPEIAGHPDWAVEIERVHGWLEDLADRIERRDMHSRRRYHIGDGMVEVVDPVGNPEFCANCERIRLTHEGQLKGCLNRNDDLRPTGDMTKPELRTAIRATVETRVPFYGEYMIRDDDGGWTLNEEYAEPHVVSR
jgi:cyclic pyranopterin phosphate synthase